MTTCFGIPRSRFKLALRKEDGFYEDQGTSDYTDGYQSHLDGRAGG